MQPQEIPIHRSQISTSVGTWLCDVQSAIQTQDGKSVLLKVLLEQSIDEERTQTRALEVIMPSSFLHDPEISPDLIDRVKTWIENTEEDGYLDLT